MSDTRIPLDKFEKIPVNSSLPKLNDDASYRLHELCSDLVREWDGAFSSVHSIKGMVDEIPELIEIKDGYIYFTEIGKEYVKNYATLTKGNSGDSYRKKNFEGVLAKNYLDKKQPIKVYRDSWLIEKVKKGEIEALLYVGLANWVGGKFVRPAQDRVDTYLLSLAKKQASYKKSQAKKASNMKIQLEIIELKDDHTIERLRFRANGSIKLVLGNNHLYYGRASFQHFAQTNLEAFTDYMALAVPMWLCKELADASILCEDATVKMIYRKCLTRYTDAEKESANV